MRVPFKTSKAGFTLIELLVSVVIIVIITSVLAANYEKFDGGIVLTDLAYDIGLSIRKAQIYGLGVKGEEGVFTYPYGVRFNTASPQSYILYVDIDGDRLYDGDPEKVETYRLQSGFTIHRLCVNNTTCTTSNSPGGILDVTFVRPNPDAAINNNPANSSATVVIRSSQTTLKKVIIRTTGQISVTN